MCISYDDYEKAFETNDDEVILEVTEMKFNEFEPLKEEALKYGYNYIGEGTNGTDDGRKFIQYNKIKF